MIKNHTTGELAYIDSFSGLIPCKVMEITPRLITVKITATRRVFYKGELIDCDPNHVVPRDSVFTRCGNYHIHNNYQWIKQGGNE